MQRSRTAKLAILCAASILPAGWGVGQSFGQIIKHYNPDHVDINHGLAYLGQILFVALVVIVALVLLSIYLAVKTAARGNTEDAKLTWQILGVQVGFIAIALLINTLFKV